MSEKNEQIVSNDEELSEASLESVAGGLSQPAPIVGCIPEPIVCPPMDPPVCWTPVDPAILVIN